MKEKYGKYPHRLYIYWTSIEDSQQAIMEIPFNRDAINSVEKYFNHIINDIQNKDFIIKKYQNPKYVMRVILKIIV